ncbi:MAG: Maf family protein [Coriobacteriia bacterium]
MDRPSHAPLLLASASPRRRRLLAWLGVPYGVTATDTPEDLAGPLAKDPPALAVSLAAEKALAARRSADDATVVACDTLVILGTEVLGKPRDLDDACRMLRALSGRVHEVVTGVALLAPGEGPGRSFPVTTRVRMRALSDADIAAWVADGELMGCAGAYNIERHLASVDDGECYQNVAGLPLCHLYAALRDEIDGLTPPVAACDAARGTRCSLGPRLATRVSR